MEHQSLTTLVVTFIVVNIVVFGAIEFFLAGRKNKWIGLIIPLLSLMVLIPSTFTFVDVFFPIPLWEHEFGDETLDDVKIAFGIIYDKKGDIDAISDLQVKDRDTGEKAWYPMEFDKQGRLVGGEDALKYKKYIERLPEPGDLFTGKSCSPQEMKWRYVKNNINGYRDAVISMAMSMISVAFYFIFYSIMRRRLHRREAAVEREKRQLIETL